MIGTHVRVAAAAIVLVFGLALLGCGEKSEPATTGPVVQTTTPTTTNNDPVDQADVQAARTAAQTYLSSAAPRVCAELLTPAFLREAYENAGTCENDRSSGGVATRVEIAGSGVVVDGDGATVRAQASGGPYGQGRRVTVSLVRDGQSSGDWKVSAASPLPRR